MAQAPKLTRVISMPVVPRPAVLRRVVLMVRSSCD
jgi:hypothetical protein